MTLTLTQSTALYSVLADASRLRLLHLLEHFELSVAELTEITDLAQSRVSTHLARLKRAHLVQDKRSGNAALYSLNPDNTQAREVWQLLGTRLDDAQLRMDRERAVQVINNRKHGQTWAESVAGRMELHYSPGRTWEATARALMPLLALGDVVDIACGDGVLAELLAEHAHSVTGVDISATVTAAARKRLSRLKNVRFVQADMHDLPLPQAQFDQVFLMHALSYTQAPQTVLQQAARLLRPGGHLVVAALGAHAHAETMRAYDHLNLGLTPEQLRTLLERCGLQVGHCRISSREQRPPYFEVITALARQP
ncbi:metalloregulator ArsR/SmtB family transcription factor [Sinimarinibacterium sp. NLF-5-8]|uniref:metalloregulator ArsR/SmtB family transcription factor n=1 Tax=Sinimarinibacterium sp. NLF-5-8 TaxID=2698684 RepID=UPI00137BDFEF|nr:metalloregulator ArsR/SmtB family transcription factor [Sinimarinibacterium sp. NLF-5-8]QHS09845.1 metalloregulator ArsR/SmtB family transcription factor [Sinimarinibacterium sp. NLF-5-8]